MQVNTITLVGKATKDAYSSDKGFSAVNVEIPGPNGRGRCWLDVVAFGNGLSEQLGAVRAGDAVRCVAQLDSRKSDRGWQIRAVVTSFPTDDAQLVLATEEALA